MDIDNTGNKPILQQNNTFANQNNNDGMTSTALETEDESANLSFAAKIQDSFYNSLFILINGAGAGSALQYLAFIIEDLQLISFAFAGKLLISLMPTWIVVLLNVFDYHGGESYSYNRYLVIFGIVAAAALLLVALMVRIYSSCWVSIIGVKMELLD
jgi:hypothetical protein